MTEWARTNGRTNERKRQKEREQKEPLCLKMAILSITVYATDGNEAENRSDANNGQSSRVSAFSRDILQILRNIAAILSLLHPIHTHIYSPRDTLVNRKTAFTKDVRMLLSGSCFHLVCCQSLLCITITVYWRQCRIHPTFTVQTP